MGDRKQLFPYLYHHYVSIEGFVDCLSANILVIKLVDLCKNHVNINQSDNSAMHPVLMTSFLHYVCVHDQGTYNNSHLLKTVYVFWSM